MNLYGNTVGCAMPQTNYNQTDPTKADYLRGKTDLDKKIQDAQTTGNNARTAAKNAQTAAENAQTTADNAQTTAVNAQAAADESRRAAENALNESKEYTDNKVKRFNIVLTVNDWVGNAAPYKQTIGIEGILGTDRPHYGPVYSENTATMLAEKEAWVLVDDMDTADGSVTFTCLEEKPETRVAVQLEVHR